MPNCPMNTALGHRGRALAYTTCRLNRLQCNINGELKVQRPEAVLSVRVIAGRGRRHCSHILRWVCSYIVSCTLYTFTLYRDRGQCSHILRWVCSYKSAPVSALGKVELSFIALANKGEELSCVWKQNCNVCSEMKLVDFSPPVIRNNVYSEKKQVDFF